MLSAIRIGISWRDPRVARGSCEDVRRFPSEISEADEAAKLNPKWDNGR